MCPPLAPHPEVLRLGGCGLRDPQVTPRACQVAGEVRAAPGVREPPQPLRAGNQGCKASEP